MPSRRGHDRSLHPMAREETGIHRRGCELRQWSIFAVVDGPGDHPYMPTRDAVGRTRSPFYGPESFTYLPESNSYICPAGQQLNYGGRKRGKSHLRLPPNPQEVRPVRTAIPVHDRTVPVSCHPHERSSSAAYRPNYTGVRTGTATAKEGRGALCRTKESQSASASIGSGSAG